MHRDEAYSCMLHREESRRASCFVFLFRFSLEHVEGHVWMWLRQEKALQLCLMPQKYSLYWYKSTTVYIWVCNLREANAALRALCTDIFSFCIPEYAAFQKKIATRIHTHTLSLSLTHSRLRGWAVIRNHRSAFFLYFFYLKSPLVFFLFLFWSITPGIFGVCADESIVLLGGLFGRIWYL